MEKDLEQSVNELWKILGKDENLNKWREVVLSQFHAIRRHKSGRKKQEQRRQKSDRIKFYIDNFRRYYH